MQHHTNDILRTFSRWYWGVLEVTLTLAETLASQLDL